MTDANQHFQVLLYYKYVAIEDSEIYTVEHLAMCKSLHLKGRILVSAEGINGTVSGTAAQTNAYMEAMHADPRFSDMEFKIDPVPRHVFRKMFVRHKREIVRLDLQDDVNPTIRTGTRLSPKAFYEKLKEENVVVIDGRNDYEYDIGHFRNAIRPEVEAFREFPEWIRTNRDRFEGKTILTYCTGGIRCEKLSALLLREGFEDVFQLHGGIIKYSHDEEVKGRLFDGKCYVFDERISVPINRTDEDVVIAQCHHCGRPEDRYVNCTNMGCHAQYVCCASCEIQHRGFCQETCETYAVSSNRAEPGRLERYRELQQTNA